MPDTDFVKAYLLERFGIRGDEITNVLGQAKGIDIGLMIRKEIADDQNHRTGKTDRRSPNRQKAEG